MTRNTKQSEGNGETRGAKARSSAVPSSSFILTSCPRLIDLDEPRAGGECCTVASPLSHPVAALSFLMNRQLFSEAILRRAGRREKGTEGEGEGEGGKEMEEGEGGKEMRGRGRRRGRTRGTRKDKSGDIPPRFVRLESRPSSSSCCVWSVYCLGR